jgi:hypothetical protein
MDCKKALQILNIDHYTIKYTDINKRYLTKQYRKMALKYHPDKHGNSPESTKKFQELVDAYHLLMKEVVIDDDNEYINEDELNQDNKEGNMYSYFLKLFMKSVMPNEYNEIVLTTVNQILSQCVHISDHIFDNVSKDISIKIYQFLSTNRNVLHLSDDFIDKIRNIVIKKYDNVIIYKLNPSIIDILEHNYYKLYIKEEFILVPLWMDELYYDCSGKEVIVFCEPKLPNNVILDDDSNIIVNIEININELLDLIDNEQKYKFVLGKKEYTIDVNNLYFKKKQVYIIKNQGLSKEINNVENINEKTDIIVHVTINTTKN